MLTLVASNTPWFTNPLEGVPSYAQECWISVEILEEAKFAALQLIERNPESTTLVLWVRAAIERVLRQNNFNTFSSDVMSAVDTLMFEIWGGE